MTDALGPERFPRLGDEQLIRLAAKLDAGAFEVLYDRHHVAAFSLAVRIVASPDRAQAVTQEAFANLWRDAGRYDPSRGLVRSWLMTMIRNLGIDAVRRLSSHERARADAASILAQPAAEAARSEHACDARSDAQSIRDALQGLPEDQRQIIELAYYSSRTQAEIAAMLKLPLSTVKSRARLGLLTLRDALLSQPQAPP